MDRSQQAPEEPGKTEAATNKTIGLSGLLIFVLIGFLLLPATFYGSPTGTVIAERWTMPAFALVSIRLLIAVIGRRLTWSLIIFYALVLIAVAVAGCSWIYDLLSPSICR